MPMTNEEILAELGKLGASQAPAKRASLLKRLERARKAKNGAAAKPAKEPKAAKANPAKAAGPREGSARAALLDLMRRPAGATMAELLKSCGWKSCSNTIRNVARQAGLQFAREPGAEGEPMRFFAR